MHLKMYCDLHFSALEQVPVLMHCGALACGTALQVGTASFQVGLHLCIALHVFRQ